MEEADVLGHRQPDDEFTAAAKRERKQQKRARMHEQWLAEMRANMVDAQTQTEPEEGEVEG